MEATSSGKKYADDLQSQLEQLEELWQQDVSRGTVREACLGSELVELKPSVSETDKIDRKEVDLLRHRVKTADTLLSYLKSKARIMAIPRFAHTSCGIRHQEGVGFVDKKGIPITEWKKNMRPPSIEHESFASDTPLGLQHETDELAESEYIERIARSVMHVSDIMELLLKRAIIAETDVDKEREKVKASQAEVRYKALQLEGMWTRVQEMERVAIGTTTVLKEMQVKLEDMEHETSRQRQRAAENEQELSKVRHDFGMLKSSIENLVTARETIVALEKRVQEMEGISERLSAHVVTLETGKRRKEAEVAGFLVENDALREQLDLKETELSAMREQLRLMFKG